MLFNGSYNPKYRTGLLKKQIAKPWFKMQKLQHYLPFISARFNQILRFCTSFISVSMETLNVVVVSDIRYFAAYLEPGLNICGNPQASTPPPSPPHTHTRTHIHFYHHPLSSLSQLFLANTEAFLGQL